MDIHLFFTENLLEINEVFVRLRNWTRFFYLKKGVFHKIAYESNHPRRDTPLFLHSKWFNCSTNIFTDIKIDGIFLIKYPKHILF